MARTHLFLAVAAISAMTLAGCATDPPHTEADQQTLQQDVQSSLTRMYARDGGLRDLVENSYGYAIFPSVGKGGLIAGGATGRGEVFEQGRQVGYAELNQVTVGAQIGGQEYAELVVFQTPEALRKFQDKEYSFSANASAVALKAGASKEAHFENGVAIFTLPLGGLMAEASIGGQTFNYQPLSGVVTTDSEQATYRPIGDTRYRRDTEYRSDTDRNPDGTYRSDTTIRSNDNPNGPTYQRTETKTEVHENNP